jgi:hypothetical protein
MRAMPDTKPASVGSGEGLQSVMPCLSKMSRKFFEWSEEIVRTELSRVICMPISVDRASKSFILNRAPSRALNEVS